MKRITLFALLLLTISIPLHTQERGIKIKAITKDGHSIALYTGSYALVVGISNYTNGWPDLPNAVRDALDVQQKLQEQGFRVTLLKNPTADQLEKGIRNFIATYGLDANNRLLFYFAGHGHTLKRAYGRNIGYIVPADAPLPSRDRAGFIQKAISMESFNTYAHNMDAKHALFLFDSCFSGSIFALGRAVPADISYKTARPVRQFITAGNEDEQVPDRSIFKQEFLAALNGEADNNGDGYVTGTELGMFLQDRVVNYSNSSQHPQYGKIRDPQLDKGDFVFVLKSGKAGPATAPPVTLPGKTTGLDLSAYEAERARLAAAKQKWTDWQNNMQRDYRKIEDMDGDENLPADAKLKMWRDFLNNYSDDNPYSNEDETMRSRARSRKQFWMDYKDKPHILHTKGGDLVFIKGGTFDMGDTFGDGDDDEKPVHRVKVNDFYMGKTEVTVGQFRRFVDATGYRTDAEKQGWAWVYNGSEWVQENGASWLNPGFSQSDDHPVTCVSWNDAIAFCRWAGGRLPTEAEWEYAARGGNKSRGYKYAGSNNVGEVAWYRNNSGGKTHAVGRKQPNELGLFDMSGNVWEWCADWYDSDYYINSPYGNPQGPATGSFRVKRGGSWGYYARYVRCADRDGSGPSDGGGHLGFRLLKD